MIKFNMFRAKFQCVTFVAWLACCAIIAGLSPALHALTTSLNLETETGAVTTASIINDASASGASAVQFSVASTSGPTAACPAIVLPAYWYPDTNWTTAIDTMPSGSILILDISGSGAGTAIDPTFMPFVQAAKAKGVRVYGYSDTTYTARPISEIQADVANYKAWYGVTDIFLDQASTDVASLPYYTSVFDMIRATNPGAGVMINPGLYPDEQYMNVSTSMMVYEDYYSNYAGATVPAWVSKYAASHFAHVVHTTTNANYATALALARSRNAGYVFVTNRTGANPYDTLPSYWSGELSTIATNCT